MGNMSARVSFAPATFGRVGYVRTVEAIRLTETFHAPGTRLRLHDHEDYTINLVLDGVVEERVGRRTHLCGPGTLLAKPAGQHHANRYLGGTVRCVVVQLCGGFADDAWPSRLAMERVVFRKGPLVRDAAHHLARVCQPECPDADLIALTETWRLLSLCVPPTGRTLALQASWVADVRELLTEPGNASRSLSDLAACLGVPPWMLSRAFEQTYGLSPSQYRRRERLRTVAGQLLRTDAPVSVLAHAAGFADHSHLVRWFRRAYGCTPTEYRVRNRVP